MKIMACLTKQASVPAFEKYRNNASFTRMRAVGKISVNTWMINLALLRRLSQSPSTAVGYSTETWSRYGPEALAHRGLIAECECRHVW